MSIVGNLMRAARKKLRQEGVDIQSGGLLNIACNIDKAQGREPNLGRTRGQCRAFIAGYVGIKFNDFEKQFAQERFDRLQRRHRKRAKKASKPFFFSREWRAVRYKALQQHGGRCQCCGASAATGVQMHVDHIKPRSRFPELALTFSNLQVLCEDCNLGKSNRDDTDWRPRLVVDNGGRE